MPLGVPNPIPAIDPPPDVMGVDQNGNAKAGATQNPLVNVGIGSAIGTGTNTLMATQFGLDVVGVGFGINLIFQFIKHFKHFDQHRFWPITLVIIGVILFVIIQQGDFIIALPKALAAAWQANLNYVSQKSAGLGLLSAVTDSKG